MTEGPGCGTLAATWVLSQAVISQPRRLVNKLAHHVFRLLSQICGETARHIIITAERDHSCCSTASTVKSSYNCFSTMCRCCKPTHNPDTVGWEWRDWKLDWKFWHIYQTEAWTIFQCLNWKPMHYIECFDYDLVILGMFLFWKLKNKWLTIHSSIHLSIVYCSLLQHWQWEGSVEATPMHSDSMQTLHRWPQIQDRTRNPLAVRLH